MIERICLCVDTSGPVCRVAVTQGDKVLASAQLNIGRTHSRSLSPLIEALLEQAELAVSDIAAYAAVVGPGSYTGLRIGVATVQGMAFVQEREVVAISSLGALAHRAVSETVQGGVKEPWTLALIDARNRRSYYALFRGEALQARVLEDQVGGYEELLDEVLLEIQRVNPADVALRVAGEGAGLFTRDETIRQRLAELPGYRVRVVPGGITAEALAYWSAEALRRGEGMDAERLQPAYLAPTQAERVREEQLALKKARNADGDGHVLS